MNYRIELSPRSRDELLGAYRYIAAQSPQGAESWLEQVLIAIESLAQFPARCPPARETGPAGQELRQMIAAGYRVVFSIDERLVRVHHIRHAAMRNAETQE